MNPTGLKTYQTYGGEEAVEQFLANFAPANPALAELTVEFVYGRLISDDTLDNKSKAAVIVTALAAMDNVPAASAFHRNAFIRNGGTAAQADALEAFGKAVIEAAPETVGEKVDTLAGLLTPELAVLSSLAACGAVGTRAAGLLPSLFRKAAAQQVEKQKIIYTINSLASYAGFPAAITTSAAYQKFTADQR